VQCQSRISQINKIFIGDIQIKAPIPNISKPHNVIGGMLIMLLFNGGKMQQSKLGIAKLKVIMKFLL
jgi:hypothetical protein